MNSFFPCDVDVDVDAVAECVIDEVGVLPISFIEDMADVTEFRERWNVLLEDGVGL